MDGRGFREGDQEEGRRCQEEREGVQEAAASEKAKKKEREAKDMKHEVKKRAQNTSRMIQHYWKSVEKVVKHNYNVLYEKKRQAQRTKRLESFVSKHLKLSTKVAE